MIMAKIKTLKDKGEVFYPQTHINAVVDDNGNTVNELVDNVEKKIPAKVSQLENDKNYALATNVQANATAINNEVARATQAELDAIEKGRQLALRSLFVAAGAEYNDTDNHIVKNTPWKAYVDSVDYKAQWDLDVVTGSVQTLTYGSKTYEYVDDNGTWKIIARVGDKLVWDDTKVIHRKGYYYLNGLGDITESEMAAIYNAGKKYFPYADSQYIGATIKTNIGCSRSQGDQNDRISKIFFYSAMEVGVVHNDYDVIQYTSDTTMMLYGATKARHVIGAMYLTSQNTANMLKDIAKNAYNLRVVLYNNIRFNVSLAQSPYISKATIKYWLQNANPTSDITITLHADAYARLKDDADIVAALAAQPLVTIVSA